MTRKINKAGLDLVKEMEGFFADAYICPAGVPTIGYGHTEGVKLGQKVTRAESEQLLRGDLEEAGVGVERLITVPLSDNQFSALTSFVFNIGEGALRGSTLRKKLNAGDYAAAPTELSRWVKAKDPRTGESRSLPGLVKRRALEGVLFLTADGASPSATEGMPQKVEAVGDGASPGAARYEVVARSGLRLRSGPGLEFDVMMTLVCGTPVGGGRERDGWIEVDLEGDGFVDGWAFKTFLRPL